MNIRPDYGIGASLRDSSYFLWKIKEVLSFLLFLGLKVNTHEVYL